MPISAPRHAQGTARPREPSAARTEDRPLAKSGATPTRVDAFEPAGATPGRWYDANEILPFELEAPWASLIQKHVDVMTQVYPDAGGWEQAVKAVKVPARINAAAKGERPAWIDAEIGLRGFSSLSELEFPKLKLKLDQGDARGTALAGAKELRLGVHGSDRAGRTPIGRVRGELAPHREALTYRVLEATGLTMMKARAARVDYVDSADGSRFSRNAFVLEDPDELGRRLGTTVTTDTSADLPTQIERYGADQLVRVMLGQALVGNWDWGVVSGARMPGDYELWNVKTSVAPDGTRTLVPYDFDLATTVAGDGISADRLQAFMSSLLQQQLGPQNELWSTGALRRVCEDLIARKPAMVAAIDAAPVDDEGRRLARLHVETLMRIISDQGWDTDEPRPLPPGTDRRPPGPDRGLDAAALEGIIQFKPWGHGAFGSSEYQGRLAVELVDLFDADRDGSLQTQEWDEGMARWIAGKAGSIDAISDWTNAVFDRADVDADGAISLMEVKALGFGFGADSAPAAHTLGFTMMDEIQGARLQDDDANQISREEMRAFARKLQDATVSGADRPTGVPLRRAPSSGA